MSEGQGHQAEGDWPVGQRVTIPSWVAAIGVPLAVLAFVSGLGGFSLITGGIVTLYLVLVQLNEVDRTVGFRLPIVLFGSGLGCLGVTIGCALVLNRLSSRRYWRYRHLRVNECPWCLYSTRGLFGNRCPECAETWVDEELNSH